MQKEKCQQIKKHVFENIASTYYGKVSLNYVYRLYSHFGSIAEIEKCLDEFVKNGIAEKVEIAQGKCYIFREIALQFGKRWNKELTDLKERGKELEDEILLLRSEIDAVGKMRDIWLDGWEDVLQDPNLYPSVNNYISSVYFGQRTDRILDRLKDSNRMLNQVNKKIEEIKSKLRVSYEG